ELVAPAAADARTSGSRRATSKSAEIRPGYRQGHSVSCPTCRDGWHHRSETAGCNYPPVGEHWISSPTHRMPAAGAASAPSLPFRGCPVEPVLAAIPEFDSTFFQVNRSPANFPTSRQLLQRRIVDKGND